ncbi:MAG: hypothetical protein KF774_18745 [Planctomyces sp.]|nr:hypothetical protein [Planctomyces sp.]
MHRIRLHGPWERLDDDARVRVHLPRDWASLAHSGGDDHPLRIARRFHRPTGLTPGCRVHLSIPDEWREAVLWLNGEPIPRLESSGGRQRFEITPAVMRTDSHEVVLVARIAPAAPCLVVLEIEPGQS